MNTESASDSFYIFLYHIKVTLKGQTVVIVKGSEDPGREGLLRDVDVDVAQDGYYVPSDGEGLWW